MRLTLPRAAAPSRIKRLEKRASRKAEFPLAKQLAAVKPASGDHRADVVSPPLCDDILAYIGPSLAKYKHCDIIDGYPGVGLWSSKIHDLLQPRRHVLVEPNERYKPYLQPLVDAPGSKYVHVAYDDPPAKSLVDVLDNGLLPDQRPLDRGDARLNQPNDTLLVLLNLSGRIGKYTRGSYFATREALRMLVDSAWTHTGLHRYGQVRMLVWIGEYYNQRLVPKSISDMDSYSLSFQFRTDSHVVAEAIPDATFPREGTSLDLAGAVNTLERMQKSNFSVPQDRRSLLHQRALSLVNGRSILDVQNDLRSKVSAHQDAADEIVELEAAFQSGLLEKPKFDSSKNTRVTGNTHWERLTALKNLSASSHTVRRSLFVNLEPRWALAERARQLEFVVVDETRSAEERLAAKEEMEKLRAELSEKKALRKTRAQTFYQTYDHRKAFYRDPPLLMWDRRSFEPLNTKPIEFFPNESLALLDINPKPAPREISQLDLTYWQRFADRLFDRQALSVRQALESMCVGSANAVLPDVSSIHDPRRGGSLDIEDVRVRMMDPHMMDELINVWRNWNFRPDFLEKEFTDERMAWTELVTSPGNRIHF